MWVSDRDIGRCTVPCFDRNRQHSFLLDSSAGTGSLGLYYNLFETTGARKSIKRRYN